jgi:hypothetical protein
LAEAKAPQPIPEVYDGALNGLPLMIVQLGRGVQRRSRRPESASGHFRPINDVCALSAFHPIATKLLHYGK